MFTEDTLQGKNILITGGGSGLGLAMAKGFVRAGAKVAICGRTEEKLKRAVKEIEKIKEGAEARYYVCDIRAYDAVKEMFDKIIEDFGSLEGLVNNAAGNFLAASEDLTPGGFKVVMDIVMYGSFNCTHVFGNYLIDHAKKGAVLSIATTYAETGSGFVLPSACAKAGVVAMTKSLAFEWARYGIRLNAIAPGPIPTEGAWTRLVPDERAEELFVNKIPAKRYGKPEELAHLATFVMSDMADYMTGECVVMDGGERLAAGEFNFIDNLMPREELREAFKAMRDRS